MLCFRSERAGGREQDSGFHRGDRRGNGGAPAPARDILAGFREANPQLCKRVCGWKIAHVGEIEGWKALETQQYAQAAAAFQQAAAAQPASPFPCFGEAWARIGAASLNRRGMFCKRAVSRLTPETQPFLEELVFLIRDQAYSYETQAAGAAVDYIALADTFAAVGLRNPEVGHGQEVFRQKARDIKPQEYDELRAGRVSVPLWAKNVQKAIAMRGRGPLCVGPKSLSPESQAAKLPNCSSSRLSRPRQFSADTCGRSQGNGPMLSISTVRRSVWDRFCAGILVSWLSASQWNRRSSALLDLFEDGLVKDPATLQCIGGLAEYLDKIDPRPGARGSIAYELRRSRS